MRKTRMRKGQEGQKSRGRRGKGVGERGGEGGSSFGRGRDQIVKNRGRRVERKKGFCCKHLRVLLIDHKQDNKDMTDTILVEGSSR